MKIAFRVDASIQIGIGHVMRCLTLAEALTAKGAACHFICREHAGHLINLIREKGFSVDSLPVSPTLERALDHSHWLGASQAEDAQACAHILAQFRPDWLVVDHYSLDARWEELLAPYYRRVMVIDDLADRSHSCEVLLDQNLGRVAKDYISKVTKDCTFLCGPTYALLRPEFPLLREFSLQRRATSQIGRLIISMGGIDKGNVTSQVLSALRNSSLPQHCEITVVMGATAPWTGQVVKMAETMPWRTAVKINVDNMAQLMADSDLAIGAAGATAWERCCLGLPTIMMVLADNQRRIASELLNSGAATMLDSSDLANDILHLDKYLEANLLRRISNVAASITDGFGTDRVAAYILNEIGDAHQFAMQ